MLKISVRGDGIDGEPRKPSKLREKTRTLILYLLKLRCVGSELAIWLVLPLSSVTASHACLLVMRDA